MNDKNIGYTATIKASFQKTVFNIKVDISINTLVYPEAIHRNFESLFDNSQIDLHTYQIENIIAEKFETTLDRGEFNGRMRDLLDIFFLYTECRNLIDDELLKDSILNVCKDRGTIENLHFFDDIILDLANSEIFINNFYRYKQIQYEEHDINLQDVFLVFDNIHKLLNI